MSRLERSPDRRGQQVDFAASVNAVTLDPRDLTFVHTALRSDTEPLDFAVAIDDCTAVMS
jgi:hypothetical protein